MNKTIHLKSHFFVGLLAAGLMLGLLPAQATLVRGPMLQGATTTNIYVLAECTVNASSPMTVNYGTTAAYGSSATTASVAASGAAVATYVHRIKLTGLQPNTIYHYQLTGQGATTADYTFSTLVNPGTPFRFAWSADFRDSSESGVHGQIARRIKNSHNSPVPPLFDMTGGDYSVTGSYTDWTNQWLVASEVSLETGMPVYLASGNHEAWSATMQAFAQSPDSTGANGYYGFDCGDVHITALNHYYSGGYASGSAQWNWVQQDVTNSLKPWKIAVFHEPAYTYSSGGHAGNTTMQSMTTSIFQPGGVKVVLAGHNHFYQHNLVNGIRHFTIGGGGAPLHLVVTNPSTVRTVSDNCYLIVDASPTNLHMVVYNNIGTVLDTIDLFKPAAPTNLTSVAGNSQATLNWNRVASATNYTLYYGTANGGPYPNNKNVTTTNSTVTGLVNGTPYYFVVIDSDTNGPSAISAQTVITPTLPPSIVLTTPADGDRFRAPATIGLTATVTTNGNTISKVQFYNFTTNLIGEDLAPPYTYSWTNVSAGNCSVQARLVYNGSLTVNSVSANLVVTNLPPVFTGFAVQPDGTFTVSGTGAAGQTYILWATTNLADPLAWLPLATNNADGSDGFYFSDSSNTNYLQRYYRLGIP